MTLKKLTDRRRRGNKWKKVKLRSKLENFVRNNSKADQVKDTKLATNGSARDASVSGSLRILKNVHNAKAI